MAVKIQLRGDTKALWLIANPIISEREIVLETDTGKYKIGNGSKAYADLPYHGIDGKPSRITADGFWEIYDQATDAYVKTAHKAIPTEVQVKVKTTSETVYILTITTAAGTFDTPNLKPATYTHPTFPARTSGLYKITVDANGHISGVIAVAKADITSLGIPSQDTTYTHPVGAGNTHIPAGGAAGQYLKWSASGIAVWAADNNTTYGVATPTANGLMSGIDKARLDDAVIPTDVFTVTALTALSPTKYSQKFTYTTTTVQAINFSSVPEVGFECMLDILNSTASSVTQIIPNAAAWQCEETSLVIPAGKVGSISIRYIHGKYCVRVGL